MIEFVISFLLSILAGALAVLVVIGLQLIRRYFDRLEHRRTVRRALSDFRERPDQW